MGIVAVFVRIIGLDVPLDGLAAPFQLSVGVAGIVYGTVGFYLCYDMCRRLYPSAAAFWATVIAWLATSAVYYTLVSPAYSHAVSLFAVALFCHTWMRTRDQDSIGRYLLLGALGGLVALVRWQDIIVLALPIVELAHAIVTRRRPFASAAIRAAALVPPLLVMFLPQIVAWRSIYGQFIVMPQGSGFMHWTSPAIISVLFSLNHGLFSWTPVVLLAVLGFRFLTQRDAVLGWAACVVLLQAVYINAAVSDWWAGEAFGARRFVGYSVFFVLGLAGVLAKARPTLVRWTAVGLIVYNLLFFLQYQLFMRGFEALAPYPTSAREVFVDRLVVPWRLLKSWLES